MEKDIGMPIHAFFASDYGGVIEAMRFKKVDIAWYGNKSAMEAVDRAGAEIFAQVINKDGEPGYWSLILVHKDSPIKDLEQLLGHSQEYTFSMGDPNSTSGTLVPSVYVFAENKVNPKTAFRRCTNGNHESNALAVATKQVDAATCNTEIWSRLEKTNPEKKDQLRILWKSPLIPADPMAWRKDLPQATKDKIKAFFVNYGKDDHEKKVVIDLQWAGFKPSGDYQLLPIRILECAKKKAKIEADATIPDADKQKQIAELDAMAAQYQEESKKLAKVQ
jgi:phosphonate transport system substrate-binding protein